MAINTCGSSFFSRITVFMVIFSFVESSINYSNALLSNPVTDPCVGHKDGRARALNTDSLIGSCSEYFECLNGMKTTDEPFTCDSNTPYFDAETQECVRNVDVCFNCPVDLAYKLVAVPHAPAQFIQCFQYRALLLACSDDLEFDDRIEQCNSKRLCRDKNLNGRRCQIGGPHYEIDFNDPTVYYICWDQWNNLCAECPYGLKFNPYKETCEYA